MNKGLEALENICNKGCDYCDKWHYEHNLFCKKELGGCSKCVFCGNEKEIIEKKLKALEVIIAKRLNVDEIYHKDYEWYLLDHKNDDSELIPTKEEYDLLKEVLL